MDSHGSASSAPSSESRRQVIARYARRQQNGKVLFCSPSKAELAGEMPRRETSGSDGKVVFPDLATAEAAAAELEALGSRPMYAYLCHRSRKGHAHLASAVPGLQRRHDADGSCLGATSRSAGGDVTRRRQTDPSALPRELPEFRGVEQMPDGTWQAIHESGRTITAPTLRHLVFVEGPAVRIAVAWRCV